MKVTVYARHKVQGIISVFYDAEETSISNVLTWANERFAPNIEDCFGIRESHGKYEKHHGDFMKGIV